MVSKWHVITGAPCSGKTTLLEQLEKLGYIAVPESARVLIDNEMKSGKKREEVRTNESEFQRRVLMMNVKSEKNLPKDKTVFLDRGIPDSIAFYRHCNLNTDEVMNFCRQKNYGNIFLLERLPFEKDYARVEDEKIAAKLQLMLKEAYRGLGYDVIEIPIAPVEERIRMILDAISRQ